jgi:hypothetical protein
MMFHGVEATQKTLMMIVARKMLMYFGYKPLTSLLKGYVPVHIESEMQFQISTGGSEIGHTCCDLVADCCEHEAESNKELCSS